MTARATAQPSGGDGASIQPYDMVRAGYANLITNMTREQLTHQAFFLHKLAWDRGERVAELQARLNTAEQVIATARKNTPMTVQTVNGAVRCLDCGGINGHTPECPSSCQHAAIEAYDATHPDTGGDHA